ncbi:hypothetical protein CC99x_005905 [Candidatus Berkiella cookevillensis]|uniref:Uncharacterized protein n=1 Tax=Candidatus Berkiella cookevillensis TaxID=437022 RepID=A0A0Q9YTR2_9GAMM|nr:hypothetical protein [Candidatus Berkiella cookevillensis]MCS5708438.1 hypothetical protein [Candidatus Berkiella cookevillensis]
MQNGVESTDTDQKDELLKQSLSTVSSSDLDSTSGLQSRNIVEAEALRSELTIQLLFSDFQKKAAHVLLQNPPQANRLTKVQHLREKFAEEESSDLESTLSQAVDKQIQQLSSYQLLAQAFEEKQNKVQNYLERIRAGLQDKPITMENIVPLLRKWVYELQLADKLASGQTLAGNIVSDSMESKLNSEALSNKISSFHAFLLHCLLSKTILEKITHEVRYSKPAEQLTEDDIKTAIQLWDKIDKERYARLGSHFSASISKVEEWKSLMPQALSYEEMQERESTNPYPYQSDESQQDRRERRKHISGFEPCLKQLKQASVVQNLAERSRKEKIPVEKQHCELSDPQRLEMQFKLGIRPFSKSRQGYASLAFNMLTGNEAWLTDFEGAKLDSELPVIFPDRKEQVKKQLLPLMQRKLMLNQKFLTRSSDASLDHPDSAQIDASESNQELDSIVERLHRFKI